MLFRPIFKITLKINQSLVEIERVRGFLEAVKLKDDWLSDMQKKILILESHYSTRIEGTAINFGQAQDILSGKKVKGVNRDDEKELLNYKKAMNFISKYLNKNDPISEGLVRELHKILVRGVQAHPGEYRRVQNYVVNSQTKKIIYTPPTPLEVPHLMKEFVEWINANIKKISPVIVSAICQFQFVHIHPFLDGNGRTARLLSTLILYKTGYDFKKLFTISEYYENDRLAYYNAIQSVRKNKMDMTVWLEYFIAGLQSQMRDIQNKGKKIIKNDIKLEKIKKVGVNARQEEGIRYILQNEKITVNIYQKVTSCIRKTAQRDLEDLVKKKIIKAVAKSSTDPTKHYILL